MVSRLQQGGFALLAVDAPVDRQWRFSFRPASARSARFSLGDEGDLDWEKRGLAFGFGHRGVFECLQYVFFEGGL